MPFTRQIYSSPSLYVVAQSRFVPLGTAVSLTGKARVDPSRHSGLHQHRCRLSSAPLAQGSEAFLLTQYTEDRGKKIELDCVIDLFK